MRNLILYNLILLTLSFLGCQDDRDAVRLIDRAELLLSSNPDSSRILLDSIAVPDKLSDKQLAHWCMLYGEVADTLFIDLPYVQQLQRADSYYKVHGTPLEQARIGLYLGRAYLDDHNPEMAMKTYLYALDIALASDHYNQAGYICSYMGDLYSFRDNKKEAINKFKEAEFFFYKAGNLRSSAFALRDMGRMYAFSDSLDLALNLFLKANTIVSTLNDTIAMSSICNGLGNIYEMTGDLELAKYYLFQSIELDKSEVAPNFLALSGVYMREGNFKKARECLTYIELPIANRYTYSDKFYQQYLIEKTDNDPINALYYLEKHYEIYDSINTINNKTNIIKIEKEYNYIKILLENLTLRSSKQNSFILLMISILISLCLLSLYYVRISQKNKKLHRQQFDLMQKNRVLSRLQEELHKYKENMQSRHDHLLTVEYKQKEKRIEELARKIEEQRNELLFSSPIAKKAIKLSKEVIPGNEKSPLSKRDWLAIYAKVDEIYPLLKDRLFDFGMSESETRYCYLSFFMLDTSGEAVLLNINPDSVNKTRQRIRKKLQIIGENLNLRIYLLDLC